MFVNSMFISVVKYFSNSFLGAFISLYHADYLIKKQKVDQRKSYLRFVLRLIARPENKN